MLSRDLDPSCDGDKLRRLLEVLIANPGFAAGFDVHYDRAKLDAKLAEHTATCSLCAPVKMPEMSVAEFGMSVPFTGLVNDLSGLDMSFREGIERCLIQAQHETMDHFCHQAFGIVHSEQCAVCMRPPEPEPEAKPVKVSVRGFVEYLRQRLALWVGGDTVTPVYEDDFDDEEDPYA
jgi:hypothetical protein